MTSAKTKSARIYFIEMMGVPGSFDASVYDHFEDRENEGLWFVKRYKYVPGISIRTCNVCLGEMLPSATDFDGLVLAGSYNSVHDNTQWQQTMRRWLVEMRRLKKPILGVCGSHQLLAHSLGAGVERLRGGPFAGTFPVHLSSEGKSSPLFQGINDEDCFHYANGEHVVDVPEGTSLLASSTRVPVAALDYGNHCYSTQFHPEGSDQTLGTVWRYKAPELMRNYHEDDRGDRLLENFFNIVKQVVS